MGRRWNSCAKDSTGAARVHDLRGHGLASRRSPTCVHRSVAMPTGVHTMPTSHTIAERYLAAWNEPDAARRAALIAALWSPQGRYADPLMSGQGHDGIARMIEAARAQFPGL